MNFGDDVRVLRGGSWATDALVAGQAEFDEITSILGDVLTEGAKLMR